MTAIPFPGFLPIGCTQTLPSYYLFLQKNHLGPGSCKDQQISSFHTNPLFACRLAELYPGENRIYKKWLS